MFEPGELVLYGSSGVCRVESIGAMEGVRGVDRGRLYYKLKLLHGSGDIFAPTDTAVFMRPVLTQEEVNGLIDKLPHIQAAACNERNLTQLSGRYHAAFESHRTEDLLGLMKSIRLKERASAQRGKQLGLTDQRYQKKAEELIYGEFSVALGIPYEAVEDYIAQRLAAQEERPEAI